MKEINRRRRVYQSMKALRRRIIAEGAACAACLAGIIAVICLKPRVDSAVVQAPIRQYGSMILSLPAAGLMLTALLSFLLGVATTLLCRHLRQRGEREREL